MVALTQPPNGRAPGTTAELGNPVGVPIQSYRDFPDVADQPLGNGFSSPPGVDPSTGLAGWDARVNAGNPCRDDPTRDPMLA